MASFRPSSACWPPLLWAFLVMLAACCAPAGVPAEVIARVHGAGQFPAAVAFDAAGSALVAASQDGQLSVWAAPFGATPPAFAANPNGKVVQVSFAGDSILSAATSRGTVTEWSWKTGQLAFTHKFYGESALAARSNDGRYWAFGGALFDRVSGREAKPVAQDSQTALQFSADGKRVLSAGWHDGTLLVRDSNGATLFLLRTSSSVALAALAPRGDRVAAVLRGGEVHVWEVPGFRELAHWWGGADPRSLSFLDDGARVVVAYLNGFEVRDGVTSWQTFRGRVVGRLLSFAIEHDVAVGGSDVGAVRIWDLAQGRVLANAQASTDPIGAVAVCPRNRRVAAADDAGTITVLGW